MLYLCWRGELDTLGAVLKRAPADADLAGEGTLTAWRAQLQFWERQPDSILSVLRQTKLTLLSSHDFFIPTDLYAAWAYRMRGDQAAARACFKRSLVLLDSVLERFPDLWEGRAARGYTLAGLGLREDALPEERWLEQSKMYRDEAMDSPTVAEARARILAQAGDTQGALEEIERLRGMPALLTVHTLHVGSLWDPLRGNPRFPALLTTVH